MKLLMKMACAGLLVSASPALGLGLEDDPAPVSRWSIAAAAGTLPSCLVTAGFPAAACDYAASLWAQAPNGSIFFKIDRSYLLSESGNAPGASAHFRDLREYHASSVVAGSELALARRFILGFGVGLFEGDARRRYDRWSDAAGAISDETVVISHARVRGVDAHAHARIPLTGRSAGGQLALLVNEDGFFAAGTFGCVSDRRVLVTLPTPQLGWWLTL